MHRVRLNWSNLTQSCHIQFLNYKWDSHADDSRRQWAMIWNRHTCKTGMQSHPSKVPVSAKESLLWVAMLTVTDRMLPSRAQKMIDLLNNHNWQWKCTNATCLGLVCSSNSPSSLQRFEHNYSRDSCHGILESYRYVSLHTVQLAFSQVIICSVFARLHGIALICLYVGICCTSRPLQFSSNIKVLQTTIKIICVFV